MLAMRYSTLKSQALLLPARHVLKAQWRQLAPGWHRSAGVWTAAEKSPTISMPGLRLSARAAPTAQRRGVGSTYATPVRHSSSGDVGAFVGTQIESAPVVVFSKKSCPFCKYEHAPPTPVLCACPPSPPSPLHRK
jgi:hypothetical protein